MLIVLRRTIPRNVPVRGQSAFLRIHPMGGASCCVHILFFWRYLHGDPPFSDASAQERRILLRESSFSASVELVAPLRRPGHCCARARATRRESIRSRPCRSNVAAGARAGAAAHGATRCWRRRRTPIAGHRRGNRLPRLHAGLIERRLRPARRHSHHGHDVRCRTFPTSRRSPGRTHVAVAPLRQRDLSHQIDSSGHRAAHARQSLFEFRSMAARPAEWQAAASVLRW